MKWDEEPRTIVNQPLDTITGPVTIPAIQAVITGVLVGLFIGVLLLWLKASFWFPAWVLSTIGGILLSWLAYRGRWQYVIETVMGVDINHDGVIGVPMKHTMRVELVEDNGRHVEIIDLPVADKLPVLARGLLAGEPFSGRRWSVDVDTFTQPEFKQVQDAFLKRNLARWNSARDHRQGVSLTREGAAVCKKLADPTALPHWNEPTP